MRRGLHPAALALIGSAMATVSVAVIPVHAVEPDEILPNPALEARARHISSGLRCLVCQNQSIDDSNAPLARDLRLLVRERLTAGDSDTQVMSFVESRYGEFVLLRPQLNARTILLWLAPLLILLGAITVAARGMRRNRPQAAAASALTGAEEEKLRALLEPSKTQKSD